MLTTYVSPLFQIDNLASLEEAQEQVLATLASDEDGDMVREPQGAFRLTSTDLSILQDPQLSQSHRASMATYVGSGSGVRNVPRMARSAVIDLDLDDICSSDASLSTAADRQPSNGGSGAGEEGAQPPPSPSRTVTRIV